MLDKLGDMVRTWWQRPHWFAELWSALTLMGFSAWSVAEPGSLANLRTFHEALRLMPAWSWECAAGGVGVLQFGALWADQRWLRGVAAMLATWILTAISFGAIVWYPSPIDVFVIGFLGINIFAQMRAVGNVS